MSTKGTLILTKDNEHWYEDVVTYSPKSTVENQIHNLFLEIDYKSIIDLIIEKDDYILIEIDGSSDLAKHIRTIKDLN